MKKANLMSLLFACWQLSLFAQQEVVTPTSEITIKHLEHTDVSIRNATAINSSNLEFSPTFYQNGIVFVKAFDQAKKIDSNIGIPFFELFYSELDGQGMPTNPQPFSANVNSLTHEGPVAFNFTEDIIYYTSNSNKKGTIGKYTMKIFEAKKGKDDWENSIELPFNGEEYYSMHPSLAPNGTTLYFASNRPGGYGGTDIYYVEKIGETWSEPTNLGSEVNTHKNEAFPFIHESGMLFFSSEGHKGLGGYDIFAVNTFAATIKEVLHLGAPFNSSNADLGFLLNPVGTQGYFASSREGGMGQDDIYYFDAPSGLFVKPVMKEGLNIKITVVSEKEEEAIPNAGIYIFEKNKNGLFGAEELYEVVLEGKEDKPEEMEVRFVMKKDLGKPDFYTNETGQILTDLAENKEYLFIVTKKGYANKKLPYTTSEKPTPLAIKIPLETKNCATLSGIIVHEKTEEVIPNAKIYIKSNCDGNIQFLKTNKAGKYEVCLPFACEYILGVEKVGFIVRNATVSTLNLDQSDLTANLLLSPATKVASSPLIAVDNLEEGATIVLENIYYDFNKSAIRAGAAEELDALVNLMMQYPSMEVKLISHTDARGDARYNQKLSQARALAAKNYLIGKGINKNRLKAIGKGEEAIRNHCENRIKCSDKEHEFNRRTEVKVTKLSERIGVHYSGQ